MRAAFILTVSSSIQQHNARSKIRIFTLASSYVTLIEGAKKSKSYYKVKYVDHTYFDDYSCFGLYNSIRQGWVSGDPKVVDLVQLKYEMTSSIN